MKLQLNDIRNSIRVKKFNKLRQKVWNKHTTIANRNVSNTK